ncbi:MAG: AbrB family transcriptional regulator [Synergistaceae bacterium]|jgi:membrane AbrB-like protein|nr:AbrB family transcriptional regulator [Synergistaceae bacterium]
MTSVISLIFLFSVGSAGYIVFKKARLPLPALLGSMTAAAVLAMAGRYPNAPISAVSSACKVIMGLIMGRRLNRSSLALLRHAIKPALVVSVWMVLLSIFGGILFSRMSGLPMSTSLIGSSMGGISEMAVFALSMNFDAATVTIMGVSRLVAVLVITPWIAEKWSKRLEKKRVSGGDCKTPNLNPGGQDRAARMSGREVGCMSILSIAGGFAFESVGIPAGYMLGAVFMSGAFSLVSGRTFTIPPRIMAAAQIGIGLEIARQFGPEQIGYFTNARFLITLIVSNILTNALNLLLSLIIRKMTGWDPLTCLLSTCAGGLSQMVIVAEEMNADPLTIGILQLTRYLAIVSCLPFLVMTMLA